MLVVVALWVRSPVDEFDAPMMGASMGAGLALWAAIGWGHRRLQSTIDRSKNVLLQAPLIWQWLEAAGAHTTMGNSTTFDWANFDTFFMQTPPDAYITSDFRKWSNEGFGLFRGNNRFVATNVEGLRAFDIRRDPLQHSNLWPDEASAEKRRHIAETICAHRHLKRIYSRVRKETDAPPLETLVDAL